MNANDATLTALTAAQTGSTVADHAPNAPANPGFDLILGAAAGSALGSCGARYTLTISAIDLTTATQAWPARACQQAFDPEHGSAEWAFCANHRLSLDDLGDDRMSRVRPAASSCPTSESNGHPPGLPAAEPRARRHPQPETQSGRSRPDGRVQDSHAHRGPGLPRAAIPAGAHLQLQRRRGHSRAGLVSSWRLAHYPRVADLRRAGLRRDRQLFLDGMEFMACGHVRSASCAVGGTHTTKVESFFKIQNEGTTWYVWTKEGARSTYALELLSTVRGPTDGRCRRSKTPMATRSPTTDGATFSRGRGTGQDSAPMTAGRPREQRTCQAATAPWATHQTSIAAGRQAITPNRRLNDRS